MKFKAISNDCQQIKYLFRVFQSICKFSEEIIIRLSQNEIQLIASQHRLSSFVVRCDLNTDDFFQEYSFRGVSNENNLIYFEMRSDSLTQVLNSFLTIIKTIKFKLSHKQENDLFCIEVEYPTNDSNRFIRHDIRIGLIQRKYWHSIYETDFGPFHVFIQFI